MESGVGISGEDGVRVSREHGGTRGVEWGSVGKIGVEVSGEDGV